MPKLIRNPEFAAWWDRVLEAAVHPPKLNYEERPMASDQELREMRYAMTPCRCWHRRSFHTGWGVSSETDQGCIAEFCSCPGFREQQQPDYDAELNAEVGTEDAE